MSVITTPAPPLPVRGEHFRQAVSPMLSRLAAERATGVLLRETGSLYLSEGEVVHAESPRSPGLDVLLATGGVLDRDGWREAVDTAGAGLRVGRFLVDSGRVARGALELCHMGALFDAAYFVLGPSSAPASFRYGAAHWLGPIRPVPVAAVEREARRRRDLLHRIWPDPETDDAPLTRAADRHVPPVPARQGAVLGQVNGLRTAAEISLTLGRPAFHTLVDVRRLAAAGLISATRDSPARTPPVPADPDHPTRIGHPEHSPTAHPGHTTAHPAHTTAQPGPDHLAPPLGPAGPAHLTPPIDSGRHAAAGPAAVGEIPPVAPPWPLTTTDPDVALLQRLRDALEAL
ncbi:hypothetical protein [Streptomyces stelliscabiei]|uniref:hypothetical protein n=1 Tax=Streptomyces stelliscabiei TaxID=146820 RepID=UPI0029A79260|nr:hypothetical protein [Streptomyces stelliscabiei]MDX2551934.1 hypothetical protein [Streptomyces stelliscabiei]MDX2609698.1 hypothetical protein [Streptomyces stelliscabiei]MDX2636916.1 hypothetical protein [Streptomyces stelliscabiei]MDX2660333.1 hypothetical protein [Streptomyces stelliscabiei]MDX2710634.1 hypothetical protein [Streptomyces stelliscabiei]